MYIIIDTQTQQHVGTAKALRAASAAFERRNQAYGAVRYVYRFVA